MKQVLVVAIAASFIMGCSSQKQKKIVSQEFYKIPDNAVVEYITEANNIEKCLPNGMRLQSLNDDERRVLYGTQLDALINIIGNNNAQKSWYSSKYYGGDPKSNEYFERKQIELAHKKTTVTKSECQVMKSRFVQRLNEYVSKRNYENSPAVKQARQQANMQALQMIHGIGAQMQQPVQTDYYQQLQLEKARSQYNQSKPKHTQCYNIGNTLYCDSY